MKAWFHHLGDRLIGPLVPRAMKHTWLRFVPRVTRSTYPPPWPDHKWSLPNDLAGTPGIPRDRVAEKKAWEEGPVYEFFQLQPEARPVLHRHGWDWALPTLPARLRMNERQRKVAARQPAQNGGPKRVDAAELTEKLRAEAKRVGLNQVGFAAYDPKYTFGADGTNADGLDHGSVIVCVLEQDHALTQQIPSAECERSVMHTYSDLGSRAAALAELLHGFGYRAEAHGPAGPVLVHHYAVEAGLGQLGINGQLLTPESGSRCRLCVVTTDAELVHDKPVDYGVAALCDNCQACVRRCPSGAIPLKRKIHRGIEKTKIKPDRCAPVMIRAHGCGVCMKVCPVQRYGLSAVSEHWEQTGEILGKGSDELEGYDWIDGKRYGPGQKPPMNSEFLHPDGWTYQADRKRPPRGAGEMAEDEPGEVLI